MRCHDSADQPVLLRRLAIKSMGLDDVSQPGAFAFKKMKRGLLHVCSPGWH
jgi:hypothetical protein